MTGERQRGLLRVHLRAPLSYVESVRERFDQKTLLRDIEGRLARLGFVDTHPVMQDPTDNTAFTVLARLPFSTFTPSPLHPFTPSDGVLHAVRTEYVEELPPSFRVARRSLTLDPGLIDDEIAAVHTALQSEDNPRHLEGFASTLDPWFPVAASLLIARKKKLDVYTGRPLYDHPERVDMRDLRRCCGDLYAYALKRNLPVDLALLDVQRVASFLTHEPPPHEVKEHLRTTRIPREVLELAFCLIRQDKEGFPVIDPEAVRLACPPTGQEGFVSPAALQLALALGKPQISGVQERRRASGIASDIERGSGSDEPHAMLRAQASMEKAMKTLERQRWTEWYRKMDQPG